MFYATLEYYCVSTRPYLSDVLLVADYLCREFSAWQVRLVSSAMETPPAPSPGRNRVAH